MKQLQIAFGLLASATVLGSCGTYAGESVERDRLECYNHEDCWVIDPTLMCIHRVCVPFDLVDAGLEDVDIDLCRDHDICDTEHWDDAGHDADSGTDTDGASTCGNGIVEAAEACDDGNTIDEVVCAYGEGTCEACSSNCAQVLPLVGPECGDGAIDGDEGEVCDGDDLGEATCLSEGALGGDLSCADDCSEYDLGACEFAVCGNGVREGGELCDTLDVDQTCQDLGAISGTLHCSGDCLAYDSSDCRGAVCGNGVVEAVEVCDDGNNLHETQCAYGLATCVACSADCSAEFALTGPYCGNGLVEADEPCDVDELSGTSCVDLGADYGELRCALDCTAFDTSGCRYAECGNGTTEPGEACDDGNRETETACPYGQAECELCSARCDEVMRLVGGVCGDGAIDDEEACDDGNAVTETSCDTYGTVSCEICRRDCLSLETVAGEYCGDGITNGVERCDDGAANGELFRCRPDCGGVTLEDFVWIAPGSFEMGSPEDEPGRGGRETQHEVTLTRGFYMQATEVTRAQWAQFFDVDPSSFEDCGDDCPVGGVNWTEALAYANALSEAEGLLPCYRLSSCTGEVGAGQRCSVDVVALEDSVYNCEGYRLPTEAEWEYAARAGTTGMTYQGALVETGCDSLDPVLDQIAWYCANADGQLHPVAEKWQNFWGLYDMLGNAFEWVWDPVLAEDFDPGAVVDPMGGGTGLPDRIVRGGGYADSPSYHRAASRTHVFGVVTRPSSGFRLVRSLPD